MPSKLRSKLKTTEFYCVACRKRINAKKHDIQLEDDKRGRARLVGLCKCGCTMYKYVKESAVKTLSKRFN